MHSIRRLGLAITLLASAVVTVNAAPNSKTFPSGYTVCTNNFAPVCGANGVSYYNSCHAKAAGTRVSTTTPCMGVMTPPKPPEVISRQVLAPVKVVATGQPVRTIISTEREVRVAQRVTCSQQGMVCGEDGRTYATACDANTAGMPIKQTGSCNVTYVDPTPYTPPAPQPDYGHTDILSPIEVIVGEEVPYDKPVVKPKPRKHTHKHRHVVKHKHQHGKGHHHVSHGCSAPRPAAKPAAKPAPKPEPKPVVVPAPEPKPAPKPIVIAPKPAPKPVLTPLPTPKPVWAGQVCGTDNYTYHTIADAQAGSIAIQHNGPCKSSINIEQAPITTTTNVPTVEQCPDVDEPVCGVDNYTYQSACDAKRSGVAIKFNRGCSVKQQVATPAPVLKPVVKPQPPVIIIPTVKPVQPAHCTPAPAAKTAPVVTPVTAPKLVVVQKPQIRFHSGCMKCAQKKRHKHHDYGQHRNHGKIISRKVLAGVNFTTASADLSKGARNELQQFARDLENHQVGRIRIAGHTDNVGSERRNRKLSKMRAREVANYLTLLGLPSDKMVIRGIGSRRPIASNDDVLGRAKNRRVSITVYAKQALK